MLKPTLQNIPNEPGVYVFRNAAGAVIYVGKAKSLRKRLSSYFQPSRSRQADPKLRALIHSIADFETIQVRSDAEALLLESRLIKQYHPRYNVELRDDKRFLHVCVDLDEPFPRLALVRIRKDDNRAYFGPFPRAGVLRQTVDFLSRRFGLRSCTVHHPGPETLRHCLDHVIRDCLCPCRGNVSPEAYRRQVDAALATLRGENREVLEDLRGRMREAAAAMRFEHAAELRDMIDNLESVCGPARQFTRTTLDDRSRPNRSGMEALQAAIALECPPRVIECFDMSTIAGRLAVGSMVCFRDGRPSSADYRRFRIRSETAADDTAMMREVLCRRYGRILRENRALPDLVVVDGGIGQVGAALEAFADLGIVGLPLIGLAKRRESIVLPARPEPLELPAHHEGLKLLQAIRDEAHRFALAYNRTLRRQRILDSLLYEVPGIGKTRCRQILTAVGSVKAILRLSPEELAAAVPGLGMGLAATVCRYVAQHLGGGHTAGSDQDTRPALPAGRDNTEAER